MLPPTEMVVRLALTLQVSDGAGLAAQAEDRGNNNTRTTARMGGTRCVAMFMLSSSCPVGGDPSTPPDAPYTPGRILRGDRVLLPIPPWPRDLFIYNRGQGFPNSFRL